MSASVQNATIVGAGLVGSLLSLYLAKKGYEVNIYERRPDMRKADIDGGRSINLALSDRGWRAVACPERDVIRVTGDGRSVEIICYWPHRLAWIGDSLVVSTMDRDVLIFPNPISAAKAERP